METKDIQKMNELNRDIWGMIVQAQRTKNWALIEVNLKRLYSLQKKYINLIIKKFLPNKQYWFENLKY